jgi:type VI secretion system secreted protein VgrG
MNQPNQDNSPPPTGLFDNSSTALKERLGQTAQDQATSAVKEKAADFTHASSAQVNAATTMAQTIVGAPNWQAPSTPASDAAQRVQADKAAAQQRTQEMLDKPYNFNAPTHVAPAPLTPLIATPALEADRNNLVSSLTAGPLDDNQRLFRFYSVLQGKKRLYLHSLSGTEGMDEPFQFRLSLVSMHAGIDLKDLLSLPVTVAIEQNQPDSERYLNGFVSQFAFERTDGDLTTYVATVVPWTHFMALRVNCRIFQNQRVPEILKAIFADYGAAATFEFRLAGGETSYPQESFIVQYQESDFAFVSRLMEREGLSSFFEHRANSHTWVITNNTTLKAFCPELAVYDVIDYSGGHQVSKSHSITSFQAQRELQSSQVSLSTFDYKIPTAYQAVNQRSSADQGSSPTLEVFDGTSSYAYKNSDEGARYAGIRMQALEARAKVFVGTSDCPDLACGHQTLLLDHDWFAPQTKEQDRLLILRVSHTGTNNLPMSVGGGQKAGQHSAKYSNSFTCIRAKVPYRPEKKTPIPTIQGLQTAIVTGPAGSEIHTNKDGCIKVRFHWDRYAQFDDQSSCWIRVSQAWAGKGWGTVAIPRVGQEVVIGFLDGNPDRPMVLNSLFNGDQPPPYALPGGDHMMGFKSNSTGRGGGHSEMVIHDTGGKELVNIHSQKDMVTTVLNDKTSTITANHSTTVLKGHQSNTVALGNQTSTVQTGSQTTTVKQAIQITSTDNTITLTAAEKITFKCGASEITMDKAGNIQVNGKTIVSQATGDHTIIGAPVHLNPAPAQAVSSTIEQSAGVATQAVTGGGSGGAAAATAGRGFAASGVKTGPAQNQIQQPPPAEPVKLFDEAFVLKNKATGQPLASTEYRVKRASGEYETGTTDDTGHTHMIGADEAEQLQFEVEE